jgi:pimeloyl-ACP methyl ester carboxylesterase
MSASLRGPTILVGHSYEGMVITNAGLGESNIVGLVYISALIPAQGESLQSLSTYFGPGTRFILPPDQYGRVFVDQKGFHWGFAQDIDPEEAHVLAAVQKPLQGTTFSDASGPPAWASLPSWCLISKNDRIIQPADQAIMANRAHATTIKVPSSHFSLVSHPNAVAELIEAAARRTAKA